MKQLNLFSSLDEPALNDPKIEPPLVDQAALESALEYKILHGLSCEWESALTILDPIHRTSMKRPLFSIKDMSTRLGYWSRDKGEICLSRDLVFNHPWDAVREVLIHEMAHQMTDQVFKCSHEPPHGSAFQKTCELLRANPKASGKYPTLDDRISNTSDAASDVHLRRIRKLLALAKSQNQHEAQAAMLKAHQLIKKYNIEVIRQNEARQFISIFLGLPALRHSRDHYHLAHLLQHFYFVQGIWVSAFAIDKNRMGRVLEITGTQPNIKMASYVYHFVQRFIQSQWETYNKYKQYKLNQRIDFAAGIIEGFKSKLEKDEKSRQPVPETAALMKIEDPLLKKHMAYKYPHTQSFSRGGSYYDDSVLKDGIAIGKKLVISKGISETGKSNKLLPHK